ncbi:MAG: three-Cys-motif partner protein TcmP [Candidatus Bathyarchaeia archaeon]
MERIRTLKGYQKEAEQLYNLTKLAYPAHSWTILKLSILAYYIDLYTVIIKSRYEHAFYLDLCAGCGLNRIEETGDIVLGSACIADRIPRVDKKFDQLILFEQDEQRAAAIKKILPTARVENADSNSPILTNILRGIDNVPRSHFLAFVDPEADEIYWATIETLLKTRGDILINYMCTSIRRIWGNACRGEEKFIERMNRFFGDDSWRSCVQAEDLFTIYLEKIQRHKEVVIPIEVKGPKGFHYHVIVAVRKTKGAQQWIQAIEKAKYSIEKASHEDAEEFLRIFSGKQKTLDMSLC